MTCFLLLLQSNTNTGHKSNAQTTTRLSLLRSSTVSSLLSHRAPRGKSADAWLHRRPSNVPGKRVKFAAESDTPTAGGEDDLDLDLDGGGGGKKKTVVTEGYDSDSSAGSDDEFGGGGGRKAKAKGGEEEEEEEDMFGDKEPVEKVKGKGKDKDKEFMEMGDIEGQEFGREEGGAVEDDEDEEEDYELDDDLANNDDAPRSRRSKKSMGYVLRFVPFPLF